MKIGVYTKNNYQTLCSWYDGWKLPRTPENLIPSSSLLVFKDLNPICGGFLYQMSETPMFWIEGIISDPKSSKDDRKEALVVLVKGLTDLAKEFGGQMLLSSTPRESLTSLLKSQGFSSAPEQYNHVAKWI